MEDVAIKARLLLEAWLETIEEPGSIDGKPEVTDEMMSLFADSRKNFVAAIRKAQGLSDLPALLSTDPGIPTAD
jgi:hypothetical protein